MPKLVLIESSGDVCSAAVSHGSQIIAEKSIQEPNSHSIYLARFVDDVLKESGIEIAELDAVVIGGGPVGTCVFLTFFECVLKQQVHLAYTRCSFVRNMCFA